MTAPDLPTWTVAEDGEAELTLWYGDLAVLRAIDIKASGGHRNALFDVLTRVLAPDEATVERLRDHANEHHQTHQNDETGDVFCGCGFVYGDGQLHGIRVILTALAGTSAQARHTDDETGGGA